MINNFAKQNLCAGKHDISDSSELHFGEQNMLLRRGDVLFAQLYNLLLPYFRIFQSNLLRSIDHAQYKHYAAFYKSP